MHTSAQESRIRKDKNKKTSKTKARKEKNKAKSKISSKKARKENSKKKVNKKEKTVLMRQMQQMTTMPVIKMERVVVSSRVPRICTTRSSRSTRRRCHTLSVASRRSLS